LELILLIRNGVGVELELALFSNSDSTPTDLTSSKRTTKKLHRCPSVNALKERKIEIYKEKENFYNDWSSEMGNSNSGAEVNSGVDAFLLGVGVELELVLPTLELELEWSFEKIDGVGVELELKFLIRYGVGVEF
jgi:hypothetical protein